MEPGQRPPPKSRFKACLDWLVDTYVFIIIIVLLIVAMIVSMGFALQEKNANDAYQSLLLEHVSKESHGPGEADFPLVIKGLRQAVIVEGNKEVKQDLCQIFKELTGLRCKEE